MRPRIRLAWLLFAGFGVGCDKTAVNSACAPVDAAAGILAATADQIGTLSCATAAIPDVSTPAEAYQVDTGGNFVGQPPAYFVGGDYGQPACPDQFLVELDLSTPGADQGDIFVSGIWSVVLPGAPCAYTATTTVWGLEADAWTRFDQVTFRGQAFTVDGGAFCQPIVVKRMIPSSLGGTAVPRDRFTKVRVAVVATDCDHKIPVDVVIQ